MFVFAKRGYGVKTWLGGASAQPAADAPAGLRLRNLENDLGKENDRGKTTRIFDAPGVKDAELVYTKVEVNFRCWR
jgi:hypothetical protein